MTNDIASWPEDTRRALVEQAAGWADDVQELAVKAGLLAAAPTKPNRATTGKEATKTANPTVSLAPPQTEAQFQAAVIDLAHLQGWHVSYVRPARVLRGGKEIYETAWGGEGKGTPDVFFCRERVFWAELKQSLKAKVSPEQQQWLTWLRNAGQEAYLWTPADWSEIERRLR